METERYERRVTSLMVIFLAIAGFLVTRLGWLQLVQGRSLAATAAKYHSRTVYYRWGSGSEGRGLILDRQLRPFTEANLRPGLAVFAGIGEKEESYREWLQLLSEYSGFSPDEITRISKQGKPLPLKRPLPTDLELPHWLAPVAGQWDSAGNFQRYSYPDLACHVLGIIQPPFPGESAPGKLIGRLGIEKQFDLLLRCRRPGVSAVTDAQDRLIRGLGYREILELNQQPNVVLTLDLEIQRLVERIFEDYIRRGLVPARGAIVVMDPNSGQILAMCSRPAIRGAENHFNLATRKSAAVNMQPLASMVKVVTAAAALEKDPKLIKACFTCTGTMKIGSNTFECSHGPHGEQDLAGAMANSCNLYFAQLAQAVGGDELLAMAQAMGLGQKPEIGLPAGEVGAGSLPAPADLATAAGLANNFAMGGNKIEATPLQAAVMLSAIANGGWRVEPRLVLAVNQDLTTKVAPPGVKKERVMSRTTAQEVAALLRNVVIQGKTGYFNADSYPYAAMQLAAKTGTSDPLPPKGYQIRWCGCFFPWRRPEYVVVYLAEAPNEYARVDRGGLVAEIVQGIADLAGK